MEHQTIKDFESPEKVTKHTMQKIIDNLPYKLLDYRGQDTYDPDKLS